MVYYCPLCGLACNTPADVARHLRSHIKQNTYITCPVCGENIRAYLFDQHLTLRATTDPFHAVVAYLLGLVGEDVLKKFGIDIETFLKKPHRFITRYRTPVHKVITFKINVDLLDKLDRYASIRGLSRSEAIRRAIEKLLAEEEAKVDVKVIKLMS